MTPLPEEIAAAERIADETGTPSGCQVWTTAHSAALTAFMEAREKEIRQLDKCGEPCHVCNDAIRNGEHLR